MASDGLLNRAKKGKCRMCYRVRCTDKHVKAVGEVRHGFATGHIWECKDVDECEKVAIERMNDKTRSDRHLIKIEFERGRFKEYTVVV
jgi:hypothetical protein